MTTELGKLSTAPEALHESMDKLRELVISHNPGAAGIYGGEASDNRDTIMEMLKSDANSEGQFYQYYFDKEPEGADPWNNPAGNNLLIAIVARACFASKKI